MRGVPGDQLQRMRSQSALFATADLSAAADTTNDALSEMTGATSPRLHLELLCARLLLISAPRVGQQPAPAPAPEHKPAPEQPTPVLERKTTAAQQTPEPERAAEPAPEPQRAERSPPDPGTEPRHTPART